MYHAGLLWRARGISACALSALQTFVLMTTKQPCKDDLHGPCLLASWTVSMDRCMQTGKVPFLWRVVSSESSAWLGSPIFIILALLCSCHTWHEHPGHFKLCSSLHFAASQHLIGNSTVHACRAHRCISLAALHQTSICKVCRAQHECKCATDHQQPGVAKEALDQLLQAGVSQLAPWAQQGSATPSPLLKKKTEHEWAVSGSFSNLEERFNK